MLDLWEKLQLYPIIYHHFSHFPIIRNEIIHVQSSGRATRRDVWGMGNQGVFVYEKLTDFYRLHRCGRGCVQETC